VKKAILVQTERRMRMSMLKPGFGVRIILFKNKGRGIGED
jgi:hypothetical protein